jgi:hypothetical protein
VIHFLVNLVRLRMLTCSRLPVLFSRCEVAESIVLLDYAMGFVVCRDSLNSRISALRTWSFFVQLGRAPIHTHTQPQIDADDNATQLTGPLRTLMTIFNYIETPICTTVVPSKATWALANPATWLDGNHVTLVGAQDNLK